MARHTTSGRSGSKSVGIDGGEGTLRITGWDVDPCESLRIGIATPGRPVAGRPPRIQVHLRCPDEAESPVDLGDPPSLLSATGTHADEDTTLHAVPEPAENQARSPGRTSRSEHESSCMVAPGDTVVRTYELVSSRPIDGRLPTGAYQFELDGPAGTSPGVLTLWLTR
jgi:hypothetical protein